MKRRLILFLSFIAASVTVLAQNPLPNDPKVKVGKLENGLTYYIRHNDKPAQRAEFYLATNVGAFQETDEQDGLAHFLEHMCFNGTKNFPGKNLLNWLQGIGAEFGRNINASTGYEETQYMLNNIPIVREGIIDSCLLAIHDYSHFVSCLPEEIDAERGVILEERRTRRNADWRMFEKALPYYYGDTPYAKRTLIGSEEQLKTFKYEYLTDFYRTWYNPDMQAVVVVGDVDVDQIEQKIKKIFSDIPAPAVPTKKTMYQIPGNEEPIVAVLTDPEAAGASISVLWKMEPLPEQMNNTDVAFMMNLMKLHIQLIMQERFMDIVSQPNAPFLSGSFGIGNFCETCDAASASVSFKPGTAKESFMAFMLEIERMKRFGFTEAEVNRAKENILAMYDADVKSAESRKNAEFIQPILRNFYDNEPFMDPAAEQQLAQAVIGQLNAQILSQVAAQVITDENKVVIYNGPEKEGVTSPAEDELLEVLSAVKEAELEAPVEEVVNEPFLDPAALKGCPVKKESKGIYGSTVWKLKNGMNVVVLPTDYQKEQIGLFLYKEGGKNLVATEDLPSLEENVWSLYLTNTGISKFGKSEVRKMMTGKNLSVTPFIGGSRNGISASSTPKDLETMLQLVYLYYTEPRFDASEYEAGIQRIEAVLPNIIAQPSYKFQQEAMKTLYQNSARNVLLDEEVLEKANLETLEKVYRKLFAGVDGATAVFVGDVDLDTLKPLVEKYLGSIEKGKKVKKIADQRPRLAKGEIINHFEVEMETPKTTVVQISSAYLPFSYKNEAAMDVAKYVLDMIYVKTLREEEGGTYGANVGVEVSRDPENMITLEVSFETNLESEDKLCKLAVEGLQKLAEEGPTEEQMSNAMGNLKKNIPENRIHNSYWENCILDNLKWGVDYDREYEKALNEVTVEDVKAVLQEVLSQKNFIEVKMSPKVAK